MRVVSMIAAITLLVLTALTLVPAASVFHTYLSIASVAVAGLLLVAIIASRERESRTRAADR